VDLLDNPDELDALDMPDELEALDMSDELDALDMSDSVETLFLMAGLADKTDPKSSAVLEGLISEKDKDVETLTNEILLLRSTYFKILKHLGNLNQKKKVKSFHKTLSGSENSLSFRRIRIHQRLVKIN